MTQFAFSKIGEIRIHQLVLAQNNEWITPKRLRPWPPIGKMVGRALDRTLSHNDYRDIYKFGEFFERISEH